MRIFILMSLSLFLLIMPAGAQFGGIHVGIPTHHPYPTGGGGGPVIPSNAMTFNGAYMTFNGAYMTFSGTP